MGRPKHLIQHEGKTWLEWIVGRLRSQVGQVVVAGRGEIPSSLSNIQVVSDVPGLQGPLAGVVAVFRRYPGISWLVAACDLPYLEEEALVWLLSCRGPRVRAVLPDLDGDGRLEPLLAYYDRECRDALEELVAAGGQRLSALAGKSGVVTPQPPVGLHGSWRNMNRPEDVLKG